MEMRTNAGYTITDSVHIGKAEFVIGEMPNAPAPFVTWECKNGNNYFWGHYFSTRQAAERDLFCLLYTSPSPRDRQKSRMPSSA